MFSAPKGQHLIVSLQTEGGIQQSFISHRISGCAMKLPLLLLSTCTQMCSGSSPNTPEQIWRMHGGKEREVFLHSQKSTSLDTAHSNRTYPFFPLQPHKTDTELGTLQSRKGCCVCRLERRKGKFIHATLDFTQAISQVLLLLYV